MGKKLGLQSYFLTTSKSLIKHFVFSIILPNFKQIPNTVLEKGKYVYNNTFQLP